MILLASYSFLFLISWLVDIDQTRSEFDSFKEFFVSTPVQRFMIFWTLLVIPIIAVNRFEGPAVFPDNEVVKIMLTMVLAGLISFFWAHFLYQLDIYAAEPIKWLVACFFLSCVCVSLVYPLTDFIEFLGFSLNGEFLNDFWYCVFGIGTIEEIAKLIPFLVILYFTKQIDEPFDFIFYASISALGFAFIENLMYIYSSDLGASPGRSMYAAVGHMFFSSIIGYTMGIARFRDFKWRKYSLLVGLILASFAHGFYDFWLINPTAQSFSFLTTVFLLLSVNIWATMVNNSLNISVFYHVKAFLDNKSLKFYVLMQLSGIVAISYVGYYLLHGQSQANEFLLDTWSNYFYMMIFLVVTLTRFEIVKGYVESIRFPSLRNLLFPSFENVPNDSGMHLDIWLPKGMRLSDSKEVIRKYFPNGGKLLQRVVYKGDKDWYILQVYKKIGLSSALPYRVIISGEKLRLGAKGSKWCEIRALRNEPDLSDGVVEEAETVLLTKALCRRKYKEVWRFRK